MNSEQFLESDDYKWVSIRGEFYHVQRNRGDNWFVYNIHDIEEGIHEFNTFAAAVEEYLRLEAKKQEPTK